MALIIVEPSETKRGPKPAGSKAATSTERVRKMRAPEAQAKRERIAVLDMETDPFDAEHELRIKPFLGVLYSDDFPTVMIWEEDFDTFVEKLLAALDGIEDPYTIYAHNGGKFDYMFLVHKLRGAVSFKGRGIMSAKIGKHEIRDSFHIIPEKLAAYQKDKFDYENMRKGKRQKVRKQIIDYCIADCVYLLDIVKGFIDRFGMKISIGQAAMAELRKHYKVQKIAPQMDAFLRHFFFGGRVECLQGIGHFRGPYKLIDVNSMYPDAMANKRHPIGNIYTVRRGKPGPNTAFIELECDNHGALVMRTENNETTADVRKGVFRTTIHEYEAALELGLIENVKIKHCVDCNEFSTFEKFVIPQYEKRLETKAELARMKKAGDTTSKHYFEVKKDDTFSKLIQNNAYGKFAQNPRRFKENWLTDAGETPPKDDWGPLPRYRCDSYWIWERPAPRQSFNNVGTAASITGAARAKLMRAIAGATDPIYCDTDSLICTDIEGVEIDPVKLGAWDLEAEFDEVIIAGKKLYACRLKDAPHGQETSYKIRSKGTSGMSWEDMKRILHGEVIEKLNKGATMTKTGGFGYMKRNIRATAKRKTHHARIISDVQRTSAFGRS